METQQVSTARSQELGTARDEALEALKTGG